MQCFVGLHAPYSITVRAHQHTPVVCFLQYRYWHVGMSAFQRPEHLCLMVEYQQSATGGNEQVARLFQQNHVVDAVESHHLGCLVGHGYIQQFHLFQVYAPQAGTHGPQASVIIHACLGTHVVGVYGHEAVGCLAVNLHRLLVEHHDAVLVGSYQAASLLGIVYECLHRHASHRVFSLAQEYVPEVVKR